MNCTECGGIMSIINAGVKTNPFLRRRRQCDGCGRQVTTFETIYEPASGEIAEHIITRYLTYTPENLVTALRALSEESRLIVMELANTGEAPFNSPRLLADIQQLRTAGAGKLAPAPVPKKPTKKPAKKTGPQPGWKGRKAKKLAMESAKKFATKSAKRELDKRRGPRTEEQKTATAALKKANAAGRAQTTSHTPKANQSSLTAKSVMGAPAAVDDEIRKFENKLKP